MNDEKLEYSKDLVQIHDCPSVATSAIFFKNKEKFKMNRTEARIYDDVEISEINELYDDLFFRDNIADSLPMAMFLTPKIVDYFNVKSVLDVGCATGHWLSCYEKEGVSVNGIEGSVNSLPYSMINHKNIAIHDLREDLEQTYDVDLVTSIEVAEHIEPLFADTYVNNLTKHAAKHIIMTAAPPGQGGTGHFNLQPKKYWEDKLLAKGYIRDIEAESKIYEWCKIARGTKDAPLELRRCAVEGDGSGCDPRTQRANVTNWLTHQDAMYATTGRLVNKTWDNVWIPWWFPRNLIVLKKVYRST